MQSKYQEITAIFDKWVGKQVDFDLRYGSQCVDWARQFAKEIGNPIGVFGGSAYTGWSNGKPFQRTKWKEVKYKEGLIPTAGDIIFFGPTQSNPYGHVAVADGHCDMDTLKIVEQNAGNGNGDGEGSNAIKRTNLEYHTRGKCLGWHTLSQ